MQALMKFVNLIYSIVFSFVCHSQELLPEHITNKLTIEITDVVDRSQLEGLTLIMIDENDTLKIKVDSNSNSNLVFDIKPFTKYSTTIIKEGYDTISINWESPVDSAEIILEFFMPKLTLSRREKRIAHENYNLLPQNTCDYCGGFKLLRPSLNEMCVARYRAFMNGENSSSYKFRKLKYY